MSTNWTVYLDSAIKSIDVKQPELFKSTDQKNELNKQDLTKGLKELGEVDASDISRDE